MLNDHQIISKSYTSGALEVVDSLLSPKACCWLGHASKGYIHCLEVRKTPAQLEIRNPSHNQNAGSVPVSPKEAHSPKDFIYMGFAIESRDNTKEIL